MATGGRYRTSADLVTAALGELGVLAPGQSIDVEDSSLITNNLDSIFRQLAALEICYIPDPNNIPGEWFFALAKIVAGQCGQLFGVNVEDYQKLTTEGLGNPPGTGAAAKALKEMRRGKPTYEPLRVHYY
jgi:hypothetical protein